MLKVIMLVYTYAKCSSVLFRKDNELSQASFVSSFDDLGQIRIDNKEIMFQVTDPEIDNFDNEYIQFKFQMVKYENDVYEELNIEVEPCKSDLLPDYQVKLWYPGQFYCP